MCKEIPKNTNHATATPNKGTAVERTDCTKATTIPSYRNVNNSDNLNNEKEGN